jgi:hypothetical protein
MHLMTAAVDDHFSIYLSPGGGGGGGGRPRHFQPPRMGRDKREDQLAVFQSGRRRKPCLTHEPKPASSGLQGVPSRRILDPFVAPPFARKTEVLSKSGSISNDFFQSSVNPSSLSFKQWTMKFHCLAKFWWVQFWQAARR